MFTLHTIFNALAVIPSCDPGIIDSDNLVLSKDGSFLHIHSSPYGHKVKDGDDTANTYRYSAPDALTTVSATAQYLDEESAPHPKYMCFDSASDSLPIYDYLRYSNIIPIIDRNPRKTQTVI